MQDVKHLPELQRQEERRTLRLAVLALALILVAYGVTGAMDHAEEQRAARQAEHKRELVQAKREAFDAGVREGLRRVACWGIRVDAATGEQVK